VLADRSSVRGSANIASMRRLISSVLMAEPAEAVARREAAEANKVVCMTVSVLTLFSASCFHTGTKAFPDAGFSKPVAEISHFLD
jgi:hypothetical protein